MPAIYDRNRLLGLVNNCNFKTASKEILTLLTNRSDDAFLYKLLGKVSFLQRKYSEALKILQHSLALNDTDTEVVKMLVKSLTCTAKTATIGLTNAQNFLDGYLKLYPNDVFLLQAQISLWISQNKIPQATELAESLHKQDPENFHNIILLSQLYNMTGRDEDQLRICEKYIGNHPGKPELYHKIATLKTFESENDPIIQEIKSLLRNKNQFSNLVLSRMYFSLALIYEKLKISDKAFEYYKVANKEFTKTPAFGFSFQSLEAMLSGARQYFDDSSNLESHSKDSLQLCDLSFTPIFIVGMPRSGSTLTEQILCSNESVTGIGETSALVDSLSQIPDLQSINSSFTSFIEALDENIINNLRKDYEKRVLDILANENTDNNFKYIIDKELFNYKYLWLIKKVFPEAKIINTVRDPISILWSCYRIVFNSNVMNFTYDFNSLVKYYDFYQQFMDLWQKAFVEPCYRIVYENLVEDFEKEVKDLLSYIGLEFSPACLEFHKQQKTVQTASARQVRQALYKTSKKSWASYEKHLQPLIKKLKDLNYA